MVRLTLVAKAVALQRVGSRDTRYIICLIPRTPRKILGNRFDGFEERSSLEEVRGRADILRIQYPDAKAVILEETVARIE
jgi:hypothetical protein